jgi:hypothetical protein
MAQSAAVASGIEGVLGRVRLAPRQACKDVTLWPLILSEPDEPRGELWPLEEAMEDGFVGIGGPDARGLASVQSRAPAPVWVAAGEPLGGAGVAGESLLVAARGTARVPVAAAGAGGSACGRCCARLAQSFRALEGQVGFVASVQDRALALELVLPAGPLARRLEQRLRAWAPFLLAQEAERESPGFDSPEALLAWLAAGHPGHGVTGARVSILAARTGGCARLFV